MWVRLPLPTIEGPIEGFTFPYHDRLFVITSEGLVRVGLEPVQVQTVVRAEALATVFDPDTLKIAWEGQTHLVYDADGGDIPILDHPNGDRIVPDEDGTLLIMDPDEREVRQRIDSIRLPTGDSWIYAGFSEDGRWLVAGEPSGIQVFRQE